MANRHGSSHTFDNPPIFAEVLLQGLLGGLGVQSTDEQLPRSVCLCHAAENKPDTCNKRSLVYRPPKPCNSCKHTGATVREAPGHPDGAAVVTLLLARLWKGAVEMRKMAINVRPVEASYSANAS